MKPLKKIAIAITVPVLALAVLSVASPETLRELPGPLFAGESDEEAPLDPNAPTSLIGPIVNTYASARSLNSDLRKIPRLPVQAQPSRPELGSPTAPAATSTTTSPNVQAITASAPSASTSFNGLDYATIGAGFPADPNGDVGPSHYIEAVNTGLMIYDKSGTSLLPSALTFNAFFQAAGVTNACGLYNYGDPYVLYDRYSGRWFISDFAFARSSSGPYYQCIAVSKTSDPVSGGWWMYTYLVSNTQLNDYPKFASWHDGIYMTANLFTNGSSYYGAQAVAFNRANLVSGAPLQTISYILPYTAAYRYPFSLLAANDVSTAATGPEYLYSDSYGLNQWAFTVNWDSPASSTFSSPVTVSGKPAYSNTSGYVPQKDTTRGLDQLGSRLMSAAQWSNASGSAAVWLSRSVGTAGPTGVLWMEIKNPGASVYVNQSGVVADSSLYRFMPTLAVNRDGTMAVAYSTSSGTTFPSLAYAARSLTGTANTLDLGEGSLHSGTGSQTNIERWGDYYSLSVDPSDGCSFWMTGSYVAVTGGTWKTRITRFVPKSCSSISAPTASLSSTSGAVGTTVNITGTNFLAGSTSVSFNGVRSTYVRVTSGTTMSAVVPANATSGSVTVTNPIGSVNAGSYTVTSAPPTTFTLSVSKSGTGSGTVASSPSGIDCGSTCSTSVDSGTAVTLTATASAGSRFTGWSGACSGTAATCTVTVTANAAATATFKPLPTLTYTGSTSASRGGAITLSATLLSGGTAITSAQVTFNVGGKNYTATTNGSGVASVSGSAPKGKGTYTITVTYAGNTTYAPASTTANLLVQ